MSMKRLRPHVVIQRSLPRSELGGFSVKPSTFDLWLTRISYISQLGLLLITLGTVYFTVIPLYQKALLDEAIARKEIDLRKKEVDLRKLDALLVSQYEQNRKMTMRGYALTSGAECSGLFLPTSEYRDKTLQIKPGPCLRKGAKFPTLRGKDRAFISAAIDLAAKRLEVVRISALRKYDDAALRATPAMVDESRWSPVVRRYVANHLATATRKERLLFLRRVAVDQLQLDITTGYRDAVRDELYSLERISWPPIKSGELALEMPALQGGR